MGSVARGRRGLVCLHASDNRLKMSGKWIRHCSEGSPKAGTAKALPQRRERP